MKPKTGYCINCDNRHGCKSGEPPCSVRMAEQGVKGASGKDFMIRTGNIDECRGCPFFRSCWNQEDYDSSAHMASTKRLEGSAVDN